MVTKLEVLAFVAAVVALAGGGAYAQDATKGEQVFKQCMTCHRIGPDAKNLIGPVLTGVIGRQSGTAPVTGHALLEYLFALGRVLGIGHAACQGHDGCNKG